MSQNLILTAGSGIAITKNTSASTITIDNISSYKTAYIPLNASISLVGTETNFIRIPSTMNNWYLVSCDASCSGSSTSGSPSFTVYRSSASSITKVNMLTTNITIDEGEYDSSTSLASAVISSSASKIYTGDKIWVGSAGSSLCGTGVTYTGVSVTFRGG